MNVTRLTVTTINVLLVQNVDLWGHVCEDRHAVASEEKLRHDINECRTNLNPLPVDFQRLHGEIHTDRVPLFFDEYTGLETLDHTRFADTDISN